MPDGGFLNILKPPQMTSHDVVDFVRKRMGFAKVGHLGTLDPPAAGVLPLALGQATKLIQHLPPARKAYRAEVLFGLVTDTLDTAGQVLERRPVGSLDALPGLCQEFRGEIMQVPPRVSALKVDGRRSYARARQGEEFELVARAATYHEVTLLGVESPRAWLHVDCGPGTYIRALARDLGDRLGCGAALSFLVRVRSGPFFLEDAWTLEDVLAGRARVLPMTFAQEAAPA